VTRTTQRYAAVQELHAHGESISAIARSLHLDIQTVRRFAHAPSLDELLAKTAERASVLDGFTAYLHQRWNQRWMKGCTDAAVLSKELKAQGYSGSDQTVRRYLRPFRHGRPTPPPGPTPPTVREATGWIMRRPDALEVEEQARFKEVLARCPHLDAGSGAAGQRARGGVPRDAHRATRRPARRLDRSGGSRRPAWPAFLHHRAAA
jgi:hypothetical protein